MGVQFNKNGVINCDYLSPESVYAGTLNLISNCNVTYNYPTDVFKDYGFDTCTKLEAVPNPSYLDSEKKTFLAYANLTDRNIAYDLGQEYTFSLYAYISEDCNANLNVCLEHENTWISNYQQTTYDISDSTKGKVIWVWGKCKASPSDGKMYIMFYPNRNWANVFTQGYQLFAGITVYKGNELLKPMNNGVSGSGFVEIDSNAGLSNHYLQAQNFYEI